MKVCIFHNQKINMTAIYIVLFKCLLFIFKFYSSVMKKVTRVEGEQYPCLLVVPHLGHPLEACYQPLTLLGIADIIVPGTLLSYCYAVDLYFRTPGRLYWILTSTGWMFNSEYEKAQLRICVYINFSLAHT